MSAKEKNCEYYSRKKDEICEKGRRCYYQVNCKHFDNRELTNTF